MFLDVMHLVSCTDECSCFAEFLSQVVVSKSIFLAMYQCVNRRTIS